MNLYGYFMKMVIDISQFSPKTIANIIFLLKLLGIIIVVVGFIIAISLNKKYNSKFSFFISLVLLISYRIFFLLLNGNISIEQLLIFVFIQVTLFVALILYAQYKRKKH
ncbi:hypothetical protein [Floccifex sp.]|uniref:hypothetical protein n=1 Tax=Floccifex sp. TaxID=2815810 RepID=UPI002A74F4CD|nr:hypothetical protein [Floccifex sp.]MDD7280517.1 hypothetical protein [Erysipelotrichaceae bacterium]MDY2958530.1 hypothetical protein [Floccifex sp.]